MCVCVCVCVCASLSNYSEGLHYRRLRICRRYLNAYMCVSVCLSVCLSLCVCVCVSHVPFAYKGLRVSWRYLNACICACACVCVLHMCSLLVEKEMQVFWKFVHACVCVCVYHVLFGFMLENTFFQYCNQAVCIYLSVQHIHTYIQIYTHTGDGSHFFHETYSAIENTFFHDCN